MPNDTATVAATAWCRCPDPLPPKVDKWAHPWVCSACGNRRRYCESIRVQNGGIVARCGQCRWEKHKRREPERDVRLDVCRVYTVTTCTAGEWRDTETYYLCDACIDHEIAWHPDADVIDGRDRQREQSTPTTEETT